MLENLKNYLGSFLSITMNITAFSHAKRYLNFLQIGNLAKAVVQVVLVADALFIAMLRTVKSILCSQDGVLLKLGFTKLELINKINFKINCFFRLGGKIKKKLKKTTHFFLAVSTAFSIHFALKGTHREGCSSASTEPALSSPRCAALKSKSPPRTSQELQGGHKNGAETGCSPVVIPWPGSPVPQECERGKILLSVCFWGSLVSTSKIIFKGCKTERASQSIISTYQATSSFHSNNDEDNLAFPSG